MSVFLDAAIAAIKADRVPEPRVYKPNEVPAKPKYPYSVVGHTKDRPLGYTLNAAHGFRLHRLTVQSFGRTSDAAEKYDSEADARLLDQSISVPGYETGPCEQKVGAALQRDPDDSGVVGLTSTYTFTAQETT